MLKDIVLIVGTHVHSRDGPNEQAALPGQRYTRHPVAVQPVSITSQSVSVSMMNSCKYVVEDIRYPNLNQISAVYVIKIPCHAQRPIG